MRLVALYRKVMLLFLILGAFVYGYSIGLSGARPSRQSGPEVQQPQSWVAFEADVAKSEPATDGRHPVSLSGRFWRDSSGSTRLEFGLTGTTASSQIAIKNVPSSTFYTFVSTRGWIRQPMVLPPKGYRPPRYQLGPNFTKHTELVQGYTVYRTVNAEGVVSLMAPDLNFFTLKRQGTNGATETYYNIRIGDPDPALFEPPVGAVVTALSEPGGIIWKPARR